MKTLPLWLFALAVTLATAPAFAQGSKFLKETQVPLIKAYVPHGYDNDDSVEIVVTGNLPSTCYKMGPIETVLDDQQHIYVTQTAYEFSGECLKGPIPIAQVVAMGRLSKAGPYEVIDGVSQDNIAKLVIAEATALGHGTDEVLYAPLSDAYLVQKNGKPAIRLVGAYPDNCLSLEKTAVKLDHDVMVVLPELKQAKGVACEKGRFPFEEDVAIETALPAEPFLLHVRSMSGASINKVITP